MKVGVKEESKTKLEPKVPSGMRWNMHPLKVQILPTGGPWTWHPVFQEPMLKGKPDKLGVVLSLEVRTDRNFFQTPHKEAPRLDFQDCSLCQHWLQATGVTQKSNSGKCRMLSTCPKVSQWVGSWVGLCTLQRHRLSTYSTVMFLCSES